jgi:hypothetical protein
MGKNINKNLQARVECRVAQSMKIIAVNKSYALAAAAELFIRQEQVQNQLDRHFCGMFTSNC